MNSPMRYFLYIFLAVPLALASLPIQAIAQDAHVETAQTDQTEIPPHDLLSFEEVWAGSGEYAGLPGKLIGADNQYFYLMGSRFKLSRFDFTQNTFEEIAESEQRNHLFAINYSDTDGTAYSVLRIDSCEGWCLFFKKPSWFFSVLGGWPGSALISRTDKTGTSEQSFNEFGIWGPAGKTDATRSFDGFLGFFGFNSSKRKMPIFYKWDDETEEWVDIPIPIPRLWFEDVHFLHAPNSTGEILLVSDLGGSLINQKFFYDISMKTFTALDLQGAPDLFDFQLLHVFELREADGKNKDKYPRYFVAFGRSRPDYKFIVFKVSNNGSEMLQVEQLLVAPAPHFGDKISAAYLSPDMLVLPGTEELNLIHLDNGSVTITPIPLGELADRSRLTVANASDGSVLLTRSGSDSINRVFKMNLRPVE